MLKNGLTVEEVKKNRELYGINRINNTKKNTFLNLLLDAMSDPIIKILLIVLGIKVVFTFQNFDWFETLGVVIAVTIASLISAISEYGSEKAFQKLDDVANTDSAKVYRDNCLITVPVNDLVVNDLVIVQTGEIVPADLEIIEGEISVNESSFTGEIDDVHKGVNTIAYKGSTVTAGHAKAIVKTVGIKTKYGSIASELLIDSGDSPLKIKLTDLASTISKIGIICAFLVVLSYLFNVLFISNNFNLEKILNLVTDKNYILDIIMYALTLGVTVILVSVPEGLPCLLALILSSNMKKMVKDNVLIRKMVGIETAGTMNILFSDKTGTITDGNLKLEAILLPDNTLITNKIELKNYKEIYNDILKNLLLNNDVILDKDGRIVGGNNTDKAIYDWIGKESINSVIISHSPFNSTIKYSNSNIDNVYYYKGAPEVLLSKCLFYIDKDGIKHNLDKEKTTKLINQYTEKGYRVIALTHGFSSKLGGTVLNGFCILKDNISKNSIDGISSILNAGVNIIMITGDSKETAKNVASTVGLFTKEKNLIINGNELKTMSDEYIKKVLPNIAVISRALPNDKSRLVRIAKELGLVVGMTGDGINDAPALKSCDVGFAMGSGSIVAKEASDIVILDNNLKSISKAILYGRTIFKSIRKFIIFQLTMNICALSLSILGPLFGIQSPVTVMQMLWINMIMDTLAGLAFSFESPKDEYLLERPLKKTDKIMTKYMVISILTIGIYTSILLILFLKCPIFSNLFRYDQNYKYLMTGFFGLFIFTGIFNSFNSRTNNINIFKDIMYNKPFVLIMGIIFIVQILLLYKGGNLFRTYGLTLSELSIIIVLSVTVIPIDIIKKYIFKYIH